jgi:hypothetical protein
MKLRAVTEKRKPRPPVRWRPWWTAPILDPLDDDFSIADLSLPLRVDETVLAERSTSRPGGIGPAWGTYRNVEPLDDVSVGMNHLHKMEQIKQHARDLPEAEKRIVMSWAAWKYASDQKAIAAAREYQRAKDEARTAEREHKRAEANERNRARREQQERLRAAISPERMAERRVEQLADTFARTFTPQKAEFVRPPKNRDGGAIRLAQRVMTDEEFLAYLQERKRQREALASQAEPQRSHNPES